MYNLRQRIGVGIAAFAIAASTSLATVPAAFADEAETEDAATQVDAGELDGAAQVEEIADEADAAEAAAADPAEAAATQAVADEAVTDAATPADLEAEAVTGWYRIAGATAYDTMKEILNFGGVFTQKGGTVIVATGDGYWDALAASGLAGVHDAPVLITPSKQLADQTKSEISRLEPNKVLVVGGSDSVSDEVINAIKTLVPAANVRRISGADAQATALKLFDEGGFSRKVAVVATSDGYWDALSVAPFAFAKDAPIFLTKGSAKEEERVLSDETVKVIKEGKFEEVVIVGGTSSVAKAVEEQLKDQKLTRLSGKTALDSSAEIAKWEIKNQGMTVDHLSVATVNGYWDALTGAALAGKQNSVLVLAEPKGGHTAIDAVYSKDNAAKVAGQVFGGTDSISDETLNYLMSKKNVATSSSSATNGSSSTNSSATDSSSAQG